MDTCATCLNEIAPQWNFCVHCGTPVPVSTIPSEVSDPTAVPDLGVPDLGVPDLPAEPDPASVSEVPEPDDSDPEQIPPAIRPETSQPHPRRRFDARLAFGVAMAAIGLLVVLYAVASLLGSHG